LFQRLLVPTAHPGQHRWRWFLSRPTSGRLSARNIHDLTDQQKKFDSGIQMYDRLQPI
jgi:hypothetical protein